MTSRQTVRRRETAAELMPAVLMIVPSGRAGRVLLQTDVLPALLEAGASVAVICPESEADRLGKTHRGIEVMPARLQEVESYHQTGVRGFCALVRSCSGNFRLDLATLDHRWREARSRVRGMRLLVFDALVRCLRGSAAARTAWIAAESRMFVGGFHDDIFESVRPTLVVAVTPGYDSPLETELLRQARARGIATAVIVRGWDNPTAKGMMAVVPDRFFAWTALMKQELIAYHGVPPDAIEVAGAPYLDFYAPAPVAPRDQYLRELGLDPRRRTVAFAAKPPASYAGNLEVIAAIATAIRENRLGAPSQLLVRLYPIDRSRPEEADEVRACRELAASFEHIAVSVPAPKVSAKAARESVAEFGDLRAMLTHADVLVNVFSTMAIEAALHDTPIVTVAFDARSSTPPGRFPVRSVERHASETHNRRLHGYGGIVAARSESELIAAISAYIDNPSRDAAGRRRIVECEAGPNRGSAGTMIGRRLAALAGARTTRPESNPLAATAGRVLS